MAKKRRRRRAKSKPRALFGIPAAMKKDTSRVELGLAAASFFGGTVAGVMLGKYSSLLGLGVGAAGVWKKNLYATSFGTGMFFSPNMKQTIATESGTETSGLEGLNLESVKENTKAYFKNLAEKIMLKSGEESSTTTSGLSGKEDVTYFINPYTRKTDQLDLSAMDKIQSQIAEMGRPMTRTYGEMDTPPENF
jgi:hypothetical protein